MPAPEILYEDNHLIAFDKPAGMLVQGDDTGDESLLEYGKRYLKEKYDKPGNVYLGLIHRLDRPASGVVLFAKTSKAASRLSEQFRKKTPEKLYRIAVHGRPPKDNGVLRNYLMPGTGHNNTTKICARGKGKEAVLQYRFLSTNNGMSNIRVVLETGRKHQIRVQFSAIGCTVVGDFRYGSKHKLSGGRAIALHAASLCISHPTKREPVRISSKLPAYWPV